MAAQPSVVFDSNPTVTINPDGTYSSVTLNNGGVVKFDVSAYPAGTNQCNISLSITFSAAANIKDTPSGTIKIGS
jgi:hypothetical protein